MFQIEITKTAERFLEKLNKKDSEIILNKIGSIKDNPYRFLKRLQGDLTADENGIESFVNSNKLSTQGLPVYDKSKIDHIYFSSLNPNNCYVAGMPSWFRIDDTHLIKYNATCG